VEELMISAIPDREASEDAFILSKSNVEKGYTNLSDLPQGSVVGSSSLRRISMLKIKHP
jgi:hydroxymethylbilane synthase